MSPHDVFGRASSSPSPIELPMKRIWAPFLALTGAVDGLGPGMLLLETSEVGSRPSLTVAPDGSATCSFSLYQAYTLDERRVADERGRVLAGGCCRSVQRRRRRQWLDG